MIHSYSWERICSCTAGNGSYAVAGCINRIPGVYFCMTEAHRTMLKQHVVNRIFQLKQTRECSNLYNPALVTAITGEEAPEPISKKKNDGSQAGKSGDEPPVTPAAKKANQSEPVSGAKKKKKGATGQPPKKKKKGADGGAIKSEEDDDSGMWTSEEE